MSIVKRMEVAVIGDEDLVNLMRLAGIRRYHRVTDELDPSREVREALGSLLADPEIGIIVLLEEYARHASDLLGELREGKKLTPVVLEIPSRQGTAQSDARAYYREYIRGFIGFDIEI